jgi:hypothetical protein
MTREERCKLAIEKGFIYNPENGLIYNRYGKHTKPTSDGYISINIHFQKINYKLKGHQFAWYWVNKECVKEIDHINGIRTDNRILNLRSVTRNQNQWNRQTAKGYYWYKRDKKWKSKIYVNNKEINLGTYNTEEEARNAYLAAKQIYHVI